MNAPILPTPIDLAKTKRFSPIRFLLWVVSGLFLVSVLIVLAFRWVNPPRTPLMFLRELDSKKGTIRYKWADLTAISKHAPLAVMAAEDQMFPYHHGFDVKAIQDAFEHNKKSKKMRGASTISQQVAKNLFLWPGRNYFRKGLEAYFTVLIELLWSKGRIIEVYLNIAEMGDGIFGIEAAARQHFNKSAKDLTAPEAALMAAILPNPIRYSPKSGSRYMNQRKEWILRYMQVLRNDGYLTLIKTN